MLLENITKIIFRCLVQTKQHIIKKMKRQATDWEKISATLISEKTLIHRIYKIS